MGRPIETAKQRWLRVNKAGPIPAHMPDRGPCWIWLGTRKQSNGGVYGFYGKVGKAWYWPFEEVNGPVPKGYILDHLCRNTICVNPSHLEPVTTRENILRGTNPAAIYARRTRCNNGHEYTKENTRITKAGARLCRTCRRVTGREEKARARAGRPDRSHASKTHCKYGHPFNETNTYRDGTHRQCKTCNRNRARENYRHSVIHL